ncbi:hypothetical protein SELMODRAFT_428550 [Selaginella moellendorffii]|uniref:Uncharacterized protein n=1 Tax=Selaginella moellendorffii TaxID=88036 RepID=D8T375_SELML|nr:hypothetical protein SELMODRAFT_428550 [Selaginella moellendorffii]
MTVHTAFKIPVKGDDTCNMTCTPENDMYKIISNPDLVVIDEVSIQNCDKYEHDDVFETKLFVLCEDLAQLPLVCFHHKDPETETYPEWFDVTIICCTRARICNINEPMLDARFEADEIFDVLMYHNDNADTEWANDVNDNTLRCIALNAKIVITINIDKKYRAVNSATGIIKSFHRDKHNINSITICLDTNNKLITV